MSAVVTVLLFTFSLTSLHATRVLAQAKPSIVIEEMRHDLGEIFEQEVYKHKFAVKNEGELDLVIEKVKPG
jgi:hypothetical protein